MKKAIFVITGLMILILTGCSNYEYALDCPDGIQGASYSGDIQPIFNNKCVSCHSGGQAPDLSEGWSYDELIEGEYVNTDSPCESSLYDVFSGTHEGRASEDEIHLILGWNQEGAPDN